jgi:hypothetical protein
MNMSTQLLYIGLVLFYNCLMIFLFSYSEALKLMW